jgi:hypothetical protein
MPSSAHPARESSLRIRVAPEEVTIHDWPLRDRPLGSLLALTLGAAASWLVGWKTGQPTAGGLAAAVLAATLWRTWLPVRYELGGSGIVQTIFGWRRRISWIAIQRCEVKHDGVLLLPDATATPLSPVRGLYLHWGDKRDAVLAHLDYYLPGRSH